MKLQLFAALAFSFFLISFSVAQSRISAVVDFSVFPAPQGNGRLMLFFGVDGKSLIPKKNEGKGWFGRATFALAVNDSTRNFFAEKIDLNTPNFAEKEQLDQPFQSSKVINLPAGKYQVELLVSDHYSEDTTREKLSFEVLIPNALSKPVLSDLILLNAQKLDPSKAIFDQSNTVIRSSDFYSKSDSVLRFYAEGHGFAPAYSVNSKLVSRVRIVEQSSGITATDFGFVKKIQPREVLLNTAEINISTLASGSYLLVWELLDSTGKIIGQSHRIFRKSNPGVEMNIPTASGEGSEKSFKLFVEGFPESEARHIVASLLPLARASEQATISYLGKKGTLTELRNYLLEFWKRRNSGNPLGALKEFQELLLFADQKYSTQTMKAYQTERGRTVLQYGKPNIVENEYSDRNRKAMQNLNTIPYEIWYYYTLEVPVHQNDVIFVFVQQNRGNANFRLLHSSAIGEVRNTEWRKALENNATYNFDRMDPNDRGEIGNPRQSR
jgi:GWxTD domain-containing protein